MSTSRKNQLPTWQTRLIKQIVGSMKINYINFDKKTESEWLDSFTQLFEKKFANLTTEESIAQNYQKNFKRPSLYVLSSSGKITQDKVMELGIQGDAVILTGELSLESNNAMVNKDVYCVRNGKLEQGNIFQSRGESLTSIAVPRELALVNGKVNQDLHPALDINEVISTAIARAAYTEFAEKEITGIFSELTHDDHFWLSYFPDLIAKEAKDKDFHTNKVFSWAKDNISDDNEIARVTKDKGPGGLYGPTASQRNKIRHDVEYVRIAEIFDPNKFPVVKQRVFQVMQQASRKNAIIIDLRNCGGGKPEGVQYLASFFFDQPSHLTTYITKQPNGTFTSEELKTLPFHQLSPYRHKSKAPNLSKLPVYILINKSTFSAAEEFAYDMQQNRQPGTVIVGTLSHGGNHVTRTEPLWDEDGKTYNKIFTVAIPRSKSINPNSGSNWEDDREMNSDGTIKKGVIPDITIAAHEDALDVATKLINQQMKQKVSSLSTMSLFAAHQDASDQAEKLVSDKELANSDFGKQSNTAKTYIKK